MRTFAIFIVILCISPAFSKQGWCGEKLHCVAPRTPAELRELLRYSGERLPLVSAHRGGAKAGLPENCIATMEDTLRHTFAIMEVDPRLTADGAIVLHHDPTLDRATTGSGKLIERTLSEVRELRLKDPAGNTTEHGIPTLDEALEWARGKTVLILDQKDVSVADRVRKIREHNAQAYAMLIVYSFKEAEECYALDPEIMMEVMIPSPEKAAEFEATGVPWSNVVAFVGHTPPKKLETYRMIHDQGTLCVEGTSRNLDRQLLQRMTSDRDGVRADYEATFMHGADLLEVDLPREVDSLLYAEVLVPARLQNILKIQD